MLFREECKNATTKDECKCWVWCHAFLTPALKRQKRVDFCNFKTSLIILGQPPGPKKKKKIHYATQLIIIVIPGLSSVSADLKT